MTDDRSRREVEIFFDFLSPYSWLALRAVEATPDVTFRPRPVVYGAILDAEGAFGPGETPRKRLQAMRDVARIAALRGIRLAGPPEHPFRSLDALRTVVVYEDDPRALTLAARLADAAWQDGRDLTDVAVLASVAREVGLDAEDLGARLREASVKTRLRAQTDAAIAAGVCGVPTFRDPWGRLFHGQDRIEHVQLSLRGELPDVDELAARLAQRPASVRRASAPPQGGDAS